VFIKVSPHILKKHIKVLYSLYTAPKYAVKYDILCYSSNHTMKRITITIEDSLHDKLPKYGKSGAVNAILKSHYQKEGFDQLYDKLKQRLLRDKDMNNWLVLTVKETR